MFGKRLGFPIETVRGTTGYVTGTGKVGGKGIAKAWITYTVLDNETLYPQTRSHLGLADHIVLREVHHRSQ